MLGPIKEEGNDSCKIILKEKYLKTIQKCSDSLRKMRVGTKIKNCLISNVILQNILNDIEAIRTGNFTIVKSQESIE